MPTVNQKLGRIIQKSYVSPTGLRGGESRSPVGLGVSNPRGAERRHCSRHTIETQK